MGLCHHLSSPILVSTLKLKPRYFFIWFLLSPELESQGTCHTASGSDVPSNLLSMTERTFQDHVLCDVFDRKKAFELEVKSSTRLSFLGYIYFQSLFWEHSLLLSHFGSYVDPFSQLRTYSYLFSSFESLGTYSNLFGYWRNIWKTMEYSYSNWNSFGPF